MKTKLKTPLLNVSKWDIVNIDGFYRFITHSEGLATVGFSTSNCLLKYKDVFLATGNALNHCRNRYIKLFSD